MNTCIHDKRNIDTLIITSSIINRKLPVIAVQNPPL